MSLSNITSQRLESLLEAFAGLNIGLIGDLFLDRYLELQPNVHELSIETGLEAYQIGHVRNSPGALGTVMNNLAALGVGRLSPVTVIGDDGHGFDLVRCLSTLPAHTKYLIQSSDRLTPTYTKPLRPENDDHWSELNRLDVRTRSPLVDSDVAKLETNIRRASVECDGLIVLDQISQTDCGVVNTKIRALLAELRHERPELLIVVDSRSHLGRFENVTLKGNESEFLSASGLSDVEQSVKAMARLTGETAYCTVGKMGIVMGHADGTVDQVEGFAVPGPVDIVGAGDSATSGITACLLAGASPVEAAAVGNLVASITVQQLGTTGTASPRQVLRRWQEAN